MVLAIGILYKRWKRKIESCWMILERCTKGKKKNWMLLFLYDDLERCTKCKKKKWRPILLNSHTFGSDFDYDLLTAACIMRCKKKLPSLWFWVFWAGSQHGTWHCRHVSFLVSIAFQPVGVDSEKPFLECSVTKASSSPLGDWTKGVCSLCA